MVDRKRHLAKAFTYRFFGSAVTGVSAYVISGNFSIGAGLFVIDSVAKVGLYYVHERVWYRIKWGVHDPVRVPNDSKSTNQKSAQLPQQATVRSDSEQLVIVKAKAVPATHAA